jgi:hypothetical protein
VGRNITVYLPDDIQSMMDKFREVNWSEVCRKAIMDYVATRTAPNFEATVARLKTERTDEYGRGYKLGLDLARELPYRELVKIIEGWDERNNELMRFEIEDGEIPRPISRAMEYRRYWRNVIPGPYRDGGKDFIEGFSQALTDVYKEVAGETLRNLMI